MYFKRGKGKVSKQPITLVVFASELKRYVNNHSGDNQSWLYPPPRDSNKPITKDTVEYVTWHVGTRLGIEKRLNPHWFRHSGLSFFASDMNCNEEKLNIVQDGKLQQCVHVISIAEAKMRKYLREMGLIESEKEDVIKVMSARGKVIAEPKELIRIVNSERHE